MYVRSFLTQSKLTLNNGLFSPLQSNKLNIKSYHTIVSHCSRQRWYKRPNTNVQTYFMSSSSNDSIQYKGSKKTPELGASFQKVPESFQTILQQKGTLEKTNSETDTRTAKELKKQQQVSDENIFEDTSLPEDLRLPSPADPIGRFFAGCVDLGMAAGIGISMGIVSSLVTKVPEIASAVTVLSGSVFWVARDAIFEDGNRSFGKRMYGLEITYWDGQLATQADCVKRNALYLLFPLTVFHPFVSRVFVFIVTFDLVTHIVTRDARKAGDYLFRTRVVAADPTKREQKVLDMIEIEEMQDLEDEIAQMSPETAEALQHYKGFHSGDPTLGSRVEEAEASGYIKRRADGSITISTPEEMEAKRKRSYREIVDQHERTVAEQQK